MSLKWRKVIKGNITQPDKGEYSDWKPLLAKEALNQCVYCAIHDSALGGIRNFHVEHYRPKSLFPKFTNTFTNLFYACPICNTFKGDDWPNEPSEDFSNHCYPDPSAHDYNSFFEIDIKSGLINGKSITSCYLTEKLYLNRNQLILERRSQILRSRENELIETLLSLCEILKNLSDEEANSLMLQCVKVLSGITLLKNQLHNITPYEPQDVKR